MPSYRGDYRVVLHVAHGDEAVNFCHPQPVERVGHHRLEPRVLDTRDLVVSQVGRGGGEDDTVDRTPPDSKNGMDSHHRYMIESSRLKRWNSRASCDTPSLNQWRLWIAYNDLDEDRDNDEKKDHH